MALEGLDAAVEDAGDPWRGLQVPAHQPVGLLADDPHGPVVTGHDESLALRVPTRRRLTPEVRGAACEIQDVEPVTDRSRLGGGHGECDPVRVHHD